MGSTRLQSALFSLFLIAVPFSLSCNSFVDWPAGIHPFARTLLPVKSDHYPYSAEERVLSTAETISRPLQLLAPCDQPFDTIRVTMNSAGIPPDAAGRVWTPYTTYNLPGKPYGNGNTMGNTNNPGTPNSNGTSSEALYQRGLFGPVMDMHFAVPDGNYTVLLHYADNASAAGQRIFDVSIEDVLVEDDFDVFALAGGSSIGLVRSYPVTVNGNDLQILLKSETVNAIIQGIEIIPTSTALLAKEVDVDVDVTGCYFVDGESRATVQVRVNWNNVVPNDVITVNLGAESRTIRPGMITVAYQGGFSGKQSIVMPQDVAFEIPADGSTGTVTASFNGDMDCFATANFTAPAACAPTTCAAGTGVLGGYAFIDNNRDGIEQAGEILRQADVVVRAYSSDAAANSTLVGTTTTDAFGNYSFSGLTDGERYRVEFDFPGGGGLDQTVNGTSNRTSVQFVTAPSCGIHIGITDSEVYCQDNPQVLTPCYVKGHHSLSNAANRSAIVGFPYNASGSPANGPITNYATISQVGALWGMAFDKNRETMYSSATLKRHNGLLDRPSAPSEGMLGGIFKTDMTAPPATSTTFLVDLEDLGAELGLIGNDAARGLVTNIANPDTDATTFDKIGKMGIGDIDITPDGNFLYYTNLFERKLGRVRMDDDDDPTTPYTPVVGDLVEFDLPTVSCSASGTLRPWALKVYQGKVYVGGVCDGAGGTKSDLEAFVFAFDITANAFEASPVFDFPLTYPKGPPAAFAATSNDLTINDNTGWHPWSDDYSTIRSGLLVNSTRYLIIYPVPILSDIEFDIDGALVLGFMDRTSQQVGFLDLPPTGGSQTIYNVAGGDVLRAYFSNDNYILENNAQAGPSVGYGPGNNQGPGSGEFYNDNYNPTFSHAESFLGSLALRPGSGQVMTTVLDPTPTTNTNGIRRLSNTTGQTVGAYEIVNNVAGTNRKGNSLGDLELACELLTEDVQIGGYVWADANPDGVQASVEEPIAGVIVQLFDPVTGDLLATTTTDANGEYYFTEGQDSDPGTPGVQALMLDPNTDYTIVFGNGQYDPNTDILTVGGAMYQLTTPNTGQGPDNTLNDSNGEALGSGEMGTLGGLAGYPSTTAMTPTAGSVDHSFDVGLLPICDLMTVTASSSACNSDNNSHEVAGQITFTNAPITGTLTVMIPGFGGGMQTFDAPFTSPLDYTITGVASNGDTRSVIATFSENGGMCADTATYLAPAQCLSCQCNNFIYLNEPGANTVLKFRVEHDSSLTLVSDPFASGISSPHGLGFDANGFVYIGSAGTGRIHKFSCDGTFIELVPGISVVQTNTVIKGNYLYTTLNSSNFVQCFDLCTGTRVGYLDFAGIGPSWGLSEGEDGNLYVAGGQNGRSIVYQFPPDPALFKLTNITIYNTPYLANGGPNINTTQVGIDVDEFGNVYLADMGAGTIRKIAPDGTILATITDPVASNGTGYRNAFGIVYNRETKQLYTSQNNPNEDCIAVFDTAPLAYRGDLRVPASPPLRGKGIGILQECCPTLDSVRVDTTICAANGVSFELADLLPCDGLCAQPTTDGGWTRTEGTGGTFNDCDLSFTVDDVTTSSCFRFTGGSIGGACFPYTIDICFDIVEMTPPTIAGNSCSDPAGEALTVSVPAGGVADITYQWQRSTIGCVGFLDIPGATGTTYTPTSPAQRTFYRVKASSTAGAECEQFSNCLRVELDTMTTSTLCTGGTNSVTFNAAAGLTDVVWFNEADTQVGTGASLTVTGLTAGLEDNTESFRYTALDATSSPDSSSCPFRVTTESCLDFGDLPGGYPTTLADNGPSHTVVAGLGIGATVDQEDDGTPSALADGDGADEDGIASFPTFTPGLPVPITVSVTNTQPVPMDAILYGYIDWNGDGDFDDPNETVSIPVPNGTDGNVTLPFVVPSDAVTGQDLGVRIRLSTDMDLPPTGPASDGEVEDYLIQIPPCTIALSGIDVVCSGDNMFTVAFNVDYDFMGAAADMIQVTIGGVDQPIITPTGTSGSVPIGPISVVGPAYDVALQAAFVDNPVCSTRTAVDLIACTPECTDPDGLGGNVFNDFDNNGADAGVTEVGQENVLVEVYDCDGDLVCTTYTNADGNWTCDIPAGDYPVRVEFSTPLQGYLQPSFAGDDNGTNTQFVDAPSCEVDYGVVDPAQFCGDRDNWMLITACYVNGLPNSTDPQDALVIWDYDNTETTPGPRTIATKSQVGSLWGVAYGRKEESVYSSVFFKRHIGLYENPVGTPRPGMIFRSTGLNDPAPQTNEFFDIATVPGVDVGSPPSNATRNLPADPNSPSTDPLAFSLTGKVGMGDIDLSSDESTLFTVALGNGVLVAVPTENPTVGNVGVYEIPAPASGCAGTMRPFAVKAIRGKVYVGAVCDGTAGTRADLAAVVYEFSPPAPFGSSTAPQGEWREMLTAPLNYTKGLAISSTCPGAINNWQTWRDSGYPAPCASNNGFIYPQPMLADLEFDVDGSIIMGFMDRFGHQTQQFNATTTVLSTNFSTIASGDVLRAAPNGTGGFDLESDGVVGGVSGAGANNNQGPGGGEFYRDDSPVAVHQEPILGGLALIPGTNELVASAFDPINAVATGGVMFYNNTTGARTRGYRVYGRNNTAFAGKANGISDIEPTCGTLPIQLGNFVWEDTDADGIQDPCEPPLAGVVVKLYTKRASGDPVLVATDTTDANGNYYFVGDMLDDANWIVSDTIEEGEQYFIAFCGDEPFNEAENSIMLGERRFCLSPANTGEGTNPDQNDSDATAQAVGSFGTMPAYCTVAGETDTTNHNFDVGFKPVLCDLQITGITPECIYDPATGQSTFTVTVSLAWDYAALVTSPSAIDVTFSGQTTSTASLNTATGTADIVFTNVVGPAYDQLVTATFASFSVCTAMNITNLIACTPECTDGLGGTVWNDLDNDGTGPDTDTNELGRENVKVEVYDCNGMLVCSTFTDSTGQWSCPMLTSTTEQYRVEFTTPLQDYLQPGLAGPDNGTNTQFVMGGNCDVDHGVVDPSNICKENPLLMTSCFVSGATTASGDNSVLIQWPYASTGLAGASQLIVGTKDQVGSVWGLAYARKTQMLYTSSFLKRHSGLPDFNGDNEGDLENIYVTDIANGGTTLWLDLSTQGVNGGFIPDDAGRGLTLPETPSVDSLAYDKIGKEGLGDMEISSDFKTLYVVSLFEKQVVAIDIETKMITGRYDIPNPGCVGGEARPFALKFHESKLYVGVTCDAGTSGNFNDLSATVYQFDPATPANGFFSVLDIPLNYTKGFPNSGCGGRNRWFAWYGWPLPGGVNPNCTANFALPQPLLTDIEFDIDGSMILALVDRYGHQNAATNLEPDGTDRYDMEILAGGDLLRAYLDNGNYRLESGGRAGNVFGAANNQGPGGGEFYNGEFILSSTAASETAVGAVALLPGSGELAATVWDPFRPNGGIGVNFLSNTNGRAVRRYEIAENPAFGKGGGLGDLELLCGVPPIQLGNFVWEDTDADGIQDPCEPPLENVVVKLYTKPDSGDPVLVATDTTDANGNYYFVGDMLDEANWIVSDTIEEGERYFIAFCGDEPFNDAENTIMLGERRFCLSPANTGEGSNPDQNDSDATAQAVGSFGTMPAYCTIAGETDTTNHNFDVGFKPVPIYDLALRKTLADPVPNGVRPGDQVTFDVEVVNQGDATVYDVVVGDSIPAGLTFVGTSTSPLTSVNGTVIDFTDNYATTQNFLIDSLLAKDSVTFQVTVMIDNPYTGTLPMVNYAEIQAFDDDMDPGNTPPEDEDSTPDTNYSNDPGGQPDTPSDDETGGDGTGNPDDPEAETDEDDHDVARIPFYDLALTKVIDPGSISPTSIYSIDDPIVFNINVTNQGSDTVTSVIIKDHIPCGYSFLAADNVSAGWSAVGPAGGSMDQDSVFATIPGPIIPGDGAQVQLTLRYQSTTNCPVAEAAQAQVNRAEIRQFEDTAGNQPLDFDSTPDGDPNNDPGGIPDGPSDNVITGDGTGSVGSNDPLTDEDDADPASLNVFDLAIFKVVDEIASPPPYNYGQVVKFDFGIIDQGNLAATQIVIADLVPPGLRYDPAFGMNTATGWVGTTGADSISLTIDPTLPNINITRPGQALGMGDTALVSIWLQIIAPATSVGISDYTNYGEISSGRYIDPGTLAEVIVTGDGDSPYGLGVGNDTGGGVGTDDDNETTDNSPGEDIDSQDPAFISLTGLTLGSTVFADNNNDGMQNGTDAGIPGVAVQLFDATTMLPIMTGPDGIVGTADDADPAPVLTDASGNYLFTNLLPGDYYVVLPTAPAAAPISSNNTGIAFTETDPDDNADGDDEGTQPGGSGTAVTSGTISLSPGMEPTTLTGEVSPGSNQDENAALGYTDADGNMTLDFGFFAPVSLGDKAFVDLNGDGLQTMSEPGIGGVTVVLLDVNGDTVTVDAEGNMISGVTTTAPDGSYTFDNLPPGEYSVLFDISTADNAEFYDFTLANAGDDALDSDNSIFLSDSTAQSDPTAFLNSAEEDMTLDVGVICAVEAEVAQPFTICSTQPIDLTVGASVTPASLGGSWTSTGDGQFLNFFGVALSGDPFFRFGEAVTYVPGPQDIRTGAVTLTLTTFDPAGPCSPVSASVTINILKVDCGTFPWDGSD